VAPKHFLSWVERQAQSLRQRLALAPLAQLDPFKLASEMGARVISPADIPGLTSDCLTQLLLVDSDAWSAGSLHLPDGQIMIVLNPNHAETRQRSTLMEELSHIHLGHTPTQLVAIDGGPTFRSFKKTQETQAYWVGSAALVPQVALERARRNKAERQVLAGYFGVSLDLVAFRENVTGVRLQLTNI
jgi:hypothetical protein